MSLNSRNRLVDLLCTFSIKSVSLIKDGDHKTFGILDHLISESWQHLRSGLLQ